MGIFIVQILNSLQLKKIILLIAVAFATVNCFAQCACCAGAGAGSSNGDYNTGIITLPKHEMIAEAYGDYRNIQNGNATEDDEKLLKHMFITSAGIRYGISNKITVAALLPYVFLHTNNGNDRGAGDLMLLGNFTVYSKNNFNLAVQAGLELPTGIQKNSNFDNTTVVVGSGSYDPLAGIIFSKRWNSVILQGNALFKYTTKGFQGNYYGSLSAHNISVAYKLKGEHLVCVLDSSYKKTPPGFSWSIFTGYYGEWLGKIKEENVVDDNSGYYAGFAMAGTNFSFGKLSVPIALSLPVVNEMNGDQNKGGIRLRVGIVKIL